MPARIKKNHKTEKKGKGSFRIIAGEHRGRRLSFPEVDGLRPTTDRVRETVFNWLSWQIEDARVLDLFAGSGALGLEAASRGAKYVQFVELSQPAVSQLGEHRTMLKINAQVTQADALMWLAQSQEAPFDVVFLDPPFRKNLLESVIQKLVNSSLLSAGTLIYLEKEKELSELALPANWRQRKEKVAGQLCYGLYEVLGDKE
jgi:16S rRNA (guanine966-N2)-methyltransferase